MLIRSMTRCRKCDVTIKVGPASVRNGLCGQCWKIQGGVGQNPCTKCRERPSLPAGGWCGKCVEAEQDTGGDQRTKEFSIGVPNGGEMFSPFVTGLGQALGLFGQPASRNEFTGQRPLTDNQLAANQSMASTLTQEQMRMSQLQVKQVEQVLLRQLSPADLPARSRAAPKRTSSQVVPLKTKRKFRF